MQQKHRIAVLMGGISNEREVSLKSGEAIAAALEDAGHRVFRVDVTDRNVDVLDAIGPDVVFVALHGAFGEDGQLQRLLERKGFPYTGSRPSASWLSMEKIASKRAFVWNSVPTADYLVVARDEAIGRIAAQAEELGYPLICKPPACGSSIGVSIARSQDELQHSIQNALRCAEHAEAHDARHAGGARRGSYADCVLLERYMPGRELTVGILDDRPLPIVEVVHKRDLFDYQAKYSDENTEYTVPVSLLETLYKRAQEVSLRAYRSLGCRHFGRVDLIHGYDGGLYVLEVNTIPGFTPRSLLPMAAGHAGVGFVELCDRIVAMSLRDAARASGAHELPRPERRRHTA